MDRKKEMIIELTNAVHSMLEDASLTVSSRETSLESAQRKVSRQISQLRYGPEKNDYFWIIDQTPKMVMHPFRTDLIDLELIEFSDREDKNFFSDAVKIVKESGHGFIRYYWESKDHPHRDVPKLSYVLGYEPWGWIIGTGIYLNDVEEEISELTLELSMMSLGIFTIISSLLFYQLRQSLVIEQQKLAAQTQLLRSQKRYRKLVESSTEGAILIENDTIVFCNQSIVTLVSEDETDIIGKNLDVFFELNWDELITEIDRSSTGIDIESRILCGSHAGQSLMMSFSRSSQGDSDFLVVTVKTFSSRLQVLNSLKDIGEELQASLLVMNQPVGPLSSFAVSCSMETTVKEAAILMRRKKCDVVYIKYDDSVVGTLSLSELANRIISEDLSYNTRVSQVMTSPVIDLRPQALLYEAVLALRQHEISHLLIRDEMGSISGSFGYKQMLNLHLNTTSLMITEIKDCDGIDELRKIYERLPGLVYAVIDNSHNGENVTHIISSVVDAITTRVIELSLQEVGVPPCEFAFVVMGSEGRMEQTLKTDQDNALIIDSDSDDHVIGFFLDLAEKINDSLHMIGFKHCDGGFMAMNPKWCLRLSDWRKQFRDWISSPDPLKAFDVSTFFDMRCIYGNPELVESLRSHTWDEIDKNFDFYRHLSKSILSYRPDPNEDPIHLKKALMPLVSIARVYALKFHLPQTNTLDRIDALLELEKLDRGFDFRPVYRLLLELRLKTQASSLLNSLAPENSVFREDLSEFDLQTFHRALKIISRIQTKVSSDF